MRLLNAVLALVLGLALWAVAPTSSAADPAPSITGIAARSGPLAGGDLVTIRGYHLTGTTAVRFGGVATSTNLQVISDTHVQVRTPAHAGGGVFVNVVRPDASSPNAAVATYEYVGTPAALSAGPLHDSPLVGSHSVSCVSSSFCAMIGTVRIDNGTKVFGASVKDGGTWSAAHVFSHGPVDDVSCVTSPRKMCIAVGYDGYVSRWEAGVWRRTPLNPARTDMVVSCATSSFCQAVSSLGYTYRWNGSSWSHGPRLSTARATDISCPTTTFCYALVGAAGYRWIGSRWVAGHSIGPDGESINPYFISCSSATFCVASGQIPGVYLVFTGVAWSPENAAFAGEAFQPPSCTNPTFCAVPHGQDVVSYRIAAVNGDHADSDPPFGEQPQIDCWSPYQCMSLAGSKWWFVTKGA